jgi:hypothetical protein
MGQGTEDLDDIYTDDYMRDEFYKTLELRKEIKRKKKATKELIKKEVVAQLKKHGIEPVKSEPRGSMVEVKCKCCKQPFMARVADRKRGWGKFCSKSCKAINQDKGTRKNRIFYGT